MPLELERTTALGYSTFNLRAWFMLASLASKAGIDLWNYTNSMAPAFVRRSTGLSPYAFGEKPWTYQQINQIQQRRYVPADGAGGTLYGKRPPMQHRQNNWLKR